MGNHLFIDRLMDAGSIHSYNLDTNDDQERSTLFNPVPFQPTWNSTSSTSDAWEAFAAVVVCGVIVMLVVVLIVRAFAWWEQKDNARNRVADRPPSVLFVSKTPPGGCPILDDQQICRSSSRLQRQRHFSIRLLPTTKCSTSRWKAVGDTIIPRSQ